MDLSKFKAKKIVNSNGDIIYKTIKEHNDDLLMKSNKLYNLNYINEKYKKMLDIACEYHDYGKINFKFQERIKNGNKFDDTVEVAHNLLSPMFINKDRYEEEQYYVIANAVLQHHDFSNSNYEDMQSSIHLIYTLLKEFEITEDDIYDVVYDIGDFKKVLGTKDYIIVKGLLNRCDYSASGEYEIEYENDFLNNYLQSFIKSIDGKWNEM